MYIMTECARVCVENYPHSLCSHHFCKESKPRMFFPAILGMFEHPSKIPNPKHARPQPSVFPQKEKLDPSKHVKLVKTSHERQVLLQIFFRHARLHLIRLPGAFEGETKPKQFMF